MYAPNAVISYDRPSSEAAEPSISLLVEPGKRWPNGWVSSRIKPFVKLYVQILSPDRYDFSLTACTAGLINLTTLTGSEDLINPLTAVLADPGLTKDPDGCYAYKSQVGLAAGHHYFYYVFDKDARVFAVRISNVKS